MTHFACSSWSVCQLRLLSLCVKLYTDCVAVGGKKESRKPSDIINHWPVSKFDKRWLLSNLWAAPWCWFVSRLDLNNHQNAGDTRVNLTDMWRPLCQSFCSMEKQKTAVLVQTEEMLTEHCKVLNATNIYTIILSYECCLITFLFHRTLDGTFLVMVKNMHWFH